MADSHPTGRRSIGAVLAELRADFPDVTVSKIRFLEAQGLVTPRRTASGYRSFDEKDVQRLRYILTAQRDRFWPLKVIREALDAMDRGLQPAGPTDERPTVPAATDEPDGSGHFAGEALPVARAAGALASYGIEARHLRPFRTAADREIGLMQQVVAPLRRRNPERGDVVAAEVLRHGIALHTALVKAALRD